MRNSRERSIRGQCQDDKSGMFFLLHTVDSLLIRKCLTLLSLVPFDYQSIAESEGSAGIRSPIQES
jgi:hypothetical protein